MHSRRIVVPIPIRAVLGSLRGQPMRGVESGARGVTQVLQWVKSPNPGDDFTPLSHCCPVGGTTAPLSASFHKYGDICGERDGVEFAKRPSGRRSDKEIGAVPLPPFGLMGVVCRSRMAKRNYCFLSMNWYLRLAGRRLGGFAIRLSRGSYIFSMITTFAD